MPSQEQIDQEAGGGDLEQRVRTLEDTIATLRRNLLEPAMTRPGVLRYGGNVMQLDKNGAQINAPTQATDGQGTVGIWFLPDFYPNPGNKSSSTAVFPRSNLTGYADVDNVITRAFLVSNGKYNVTEAIVATYADQTVSQTSLTSSTSDGTSLSGSLVLRADAADVTAARATLYDAFLNFATVTATFANPAEGDFWYDTTANVFKGRNNASTVTFGAGVATDTIWNAAGDLAVGTGADTATVLAGSSEDSYYLRYSTAINSPVWNPWLKVSNQTSGFSASAGFFYRVSGTTSVTMPTASVDGRMLRIINVGSGNVTVNRSSSDTFFYGTTGLTSHTILPGECFTYTAYAGGTEWLVS